MDTSPSYQELKRERDTLLERLSQLEKENERLRHQLEQYEPQDVSHETAESAMKRLSLQEKVTLFRSLFRGREDVFARRWQNRTSGKSGYQPVCINEWKPQLCNKRKFKCTECPNRQFAQLTDEDIYRHLEGKALDCRDVIGLYVLNEDNTCHFICVDFDDKNCEHGFKFDVLAFVDVCKSWNVPCSIERSRSGNGAHVWVFFETAVTVVKARRLGNAILTEAMNRDGRITFKSYDRLFPNQDYLPEGGFGNLVALPLQGQARKQGNSVFVNEDFEPYSDQWDYLLHVKKLSEARCDEILQLNANVPSFGNLSTTSENKPWETPSPPVIDKNDFNGKLNIIKSNTLYIPLNSVSSKVVNHFKRVASFKNPEFYSRQAMRFSTYNVPRIISCAEIVDDYLVLPRGCEDAILQFLEEKFIKYEIIDKTNHGSPISITFNGTLRDEQREAVKVLSNHSNGVLSATTAYGKTIAAIGLIAQIKVNTLILVHTKALLDQWKQKLEEFLIIDQEQEEKTNKRGRKKKWSPIGTLSSSGNSLQGIIDIALLQSCVTDGEVKPLVKEYGMVIIDECHHVSAVNYERILKETTAARVYGVTATPFRKDGHHPIMFMQCGPIRYTADTHSQMSNQHFTRLLIPRFTPFRDMTDDNASYPEIIKQLAEDEFRNQLIVKDVCAALKKGRSPIVLTSLRSHVDTLVDMLRPHCPNVITLVGSAPAKEKRLKIELLQNIPDDEPMTIVATGKYVGEGFDCPRLDTLFLALPVSWKGIIAQYAGRLHRDHESKEEVRIYDYIDINVPICEAMYRRRLKGYANVGYSLKPEGLFADVIDENSVIYDGQSFLSPFLRNLSQVRRSIVISCPKIKMRKQSQIMARLLDLAMQGIKIAVFTREVNEHTELLTRHGVNIVVKEKLTLNCAILDRSKLWYGSVSILGYHNSDDNIITFHNPEIATSLLEQLNK